MLALCMVALATAVTQVAGQTSVAMERAATVNVYTVLDANGGTCSGTPTKSYVQVLEIGGTATAEIEAGGGLTADLGITCTTEKCTFNVCEVDSASPCSPTAATSTALYAQAFGGGVATDVLNFNWPAASSFAGKECYSVVSTKLTNTPVVMISVTPPSIVLSKGLVRPPSRPI